MIYRLLIFLLVSASWAAAQQPAVPSAPTPSASPAPAKANYEALLERVKKKDQSVDFQELRLAYTDTANYSPYGGDREARREMFAAINAKDYEKALTNAEAILAKNYVDINGHFGCFAAHNHLGNAEKGAYHKFVFDGLLNSIKNSGDGKTKDTAMVVISTDEEYAFFNWLGLRVSGQALVNEKGHSYDRMTVLDPKTNESVVYYFNIDKPFSWLDKSLKQ